MGKRRKGGLFHLGCGCIAKEVNKTLSIDPSNVAVRDNGVAGKNKRKQKDGDIHVSTAERTLSQTLGERSWN